MPKFKVLVTRDCTYSAEIEVEAVSKEEAAEIAPDLARKRGYGDNPLDWQYDDGSAGDPYFPGDPSEIEEVA